MKNGDFPWFFVCFEGIPWFHLPTGPTCGRAVEPSREQRVRDTSELEIYVKWIYEWIYHEDFNGILMESNGILIHYHPLNGYIPSGYVKIAIENGHL